MIKFVKGKKSNYIYDGIYGYNLPSVTKIVFNYIKSGELAYISKKDSVICGILKKLELR
jgi:hypothetical protein